LQFVPGILKDAGTRRDSQFSTLKIAAVNAAVVFLANSYRYVFASVFPKVHGGSDSLSTLPQGDYPAHFGRCRTHATRPVDRGWFWRIAALHQSRTGGAPIYWTYRRLAGLKISAFACRKERSASRDSVGMQDAKGLRRILFANTLEANRALIVTCRSRWRWRTKRAICTSLRDPLTEKCSLCPKATRMLLATRRNPEAAERIGDDMGDRTAKFGKLSSKVFYLTDNAIFL
jgi:hypothetical protein